MSSFLALIPLVSLVLVEAPEPRNSDIENIGSQSPDDITFTLATKNGRTMFRMGEAIPVEFHFRSRSEKKYELHDSSPRERVLYVSPTRLVAEPEDDVVDPLGDYV